MNSYLRGVLSGLAILLLSFNLINSVWAASKLPRGFSVFYSAVKDFVLGDSILLARVLEARPPLTGSDEKRIRKAPYKISYLDPTLEPIAEVVYLKTRHDSLLSERSRLSQREKELIDEIVTRDYFLRQPDLFWSLDQAPKQSPGQSDDALVKESLGGQDVLRLSRDEFRDWKAKFLSVVPPETPFTTCPLLRSSRDARKFRIRAIDRSLKKGFSVLECGCGEHHELYVKIPIRMAEGSQSKISFILVRFKEGSHATLPLSPSAFGLEIKGKIVPIRVPVKILEIRADSIIVQEVRTDPNSGESKGKVFLLKHESRLSPDEIATLWPEGKERIEMADDANWVWADPSQKQLWRKDNELVIIDERIPPYRVEIPFISQ